MCMKGYAFNSMKKKNSSSSRLPELGQTSSSSRKDRNKVVELAQGFVGSKMFDWIITGVIILQAIALAVEATPFVNSAGEYYQLLEVGTFSSIQSLVIAVFIVEAALRMIALYPRPQRYFRDRWNCFDFTIIILSLTTAGQFSTIARLVRLLRITRLVTKSTELRAIVSTLVRSIPSIFNILILFSILFFIYAIVGYHLFRNVDPEYCSSFLTLYTILFLILGTKGDQKGKCSLWCTPS